MRALVADMTHSVRATVTFVGQALSIDRLRDRVRERGSDRVSSTVSSPASRGTVAWRPVPDDARAASASPALSPAWAPALPRAWPPALGEIVDVAWSAVAAGDPEEIIATLRAERAASRAGFDHPHTESGCGFCRRAAAAYRVQR